MADTITFQSATPATPAASTVIATDDAGASGHVQIIKLAISTDGSATAIPADATNGLDVDVTRLPALAAGTNNIGDVDVLTLPTLPAGDNNIGNVDIVTMPNVTNAGTFAVQESGAALTALQLIDNLVLAEDAAHVSGDPGVQLLAVRKDTGATIAGTDGDYSPLQVDADGNLRVRIAAGGNGDGALLDGSNSAIKASVLDYTNSNPLAVRLTDTNGDYVNAGAGTQYTEDAAAAADPVGNAIIMVRKDTLAALTSADGDNVAARGTDKGELYVKHVDAIPVTDNGGSLTVDGTVAISSIAAGDNNIGNVDVVTLPALPAGTNNIGDVDVLTLPALPAGNNNIGDVDIASMPNVTLAAGTNTNEVVGDVAQDAAVAGNPLLIGGRASSAAPTDMSADGDAVYLWTTLKGALNVADAGGSLTVDNGGTFATQENGAALTALQLIDDMIFTDDAAFTPGTSKGAAVGAQADETSTDSIDEGDFGVMRMTLDRKLIVQAQPHTKGGLLIYRSLDLDETEEDIKTSAGQLYGMWVTNRATSARYIKFYNATAANVTVGTTTPVITYEIPANSTDHISAVVMSAMGIEFDTAISFAATTGFADNDTGAPGTNDIIINVFYK